MEKLYDLKEKLCMELDEIARKPEMSAGDLEAVHKLTDTIKNIDKICMLEGEESGGEYGRDSSYANRGKHYVRGHYSLDSRGGRRDSRGRYSAGGGRSEMMNHLEAALDSAAEQDREMIRRFMRELETV